MITLLRNRTRPASHENHVTPDRPDSPKRRPVRWTLDAQRALAPRPQSLQSLPPCREDPATNDAAEVSPTRRRGAAAGRKMRSAVRAVTGALKSLSRARRSMLVAGNDETQFVAHTDDPTAIVVPDASSINAPAPPRARRMHDVSWDGVAIESPQPTFGELAPCADEVDDEEEVDLDSCAGLISSRSSTHGLLSDATAPPPPVPASSRGKGKKRRDPSVLLDDLDWDPSRHLNSLHDSLARSTTFPDLSSDDSAFSLSGRTSPVLVRGRNPPGWDARLSVAGSSSSSPPGQHRGTMSTLPSYSTFAPGTLGDDEDFDADHGADDKCWADTLPPHYDDDARVPLTRRA
ncbi:hypothetical protein H9P43_004320 [Blastocladiella emersonii ATCC 22665]|nr:hypothetical protein H9P43_004320 [Blastocladiella emersonii ATCC 22665]